MEEHFFVAKFKEITANGMPGISAHAPLMPLNRIVLPPFDEASHRSSAVGIVLHPVQSKIHCILIKRPEYVGFHGGQISFPGGKMDIEDSNLEYTARRECFEEVDLPFELGNCIGELSSVYIPVSSFIVHPYVFFVNELPPLTPDPREVESIISFDIFDLTNSENLKTTDIKLANGISRKNIPFFDIEGHKVWGATAMILAELKEILKQFD